MKNVEMFKEAKQASIKGDYEKARKLFEKCREEENDNIMINIEVSLLDIIIGNIVGAKKTIKKCLKKDIKATESYLKSLDNMGKKYSNMAMNSEFMLYMTSLETLYYITN